MVKFYFFIDYLFFNLKSLLSNFSFFSKSEGMLSVDTTVSHEERLTYVMNEYGDHVLRLAYSYLYNMSDAEDIVQDTFIKYLKNETVFENENHEKFWLLKVCANLSKNKISYNKIRDFDELEENLIEDGREDLSFVWEAVKMLPDKYRQTIHLYYYENYSTREISKILVQNESTIRSYLYRGRQILKDILKENYDFE